MIRILAVADEVDEGLTRSRLLQLEVDLILACGDLPFDYLERLRSDAEVPLLYVHGNHDRSPRHRKVSAYLPAQYTPRKPREVVGCTDLEDKWRDEMGIRVVGLGGSVRYNDGANQFTQTEMRKRVRQLGRRTRLQRFRDGKGVDIFIAHSPPLDCGDQRDPPHRGFAAFHKLIERVSPKLMLHGHIHPHGTPRPDRFLGRTRIVNVVPYRVVEVE
ncbi:MAG: metallophosphoesterase [Acidobacteria bacterium]|nr:metallophosphoesterase [Acidobacteriota bacterium]